MKCTVIEDSLVEVVVDSNFERGPASFPVVVISGHAVKGLDADGVIRDELTADDCCTK